MKKVFMDVRNFIKRRNVITAETAYNKSMYGYERDYNTFFHNRVKELFQLIELKVFNGQFSLIYEADARLNINQLIEYFNNLGYNAKLISTNTEDITDVTLANTKFIYISWGKKKNEADGFILGNEGNVPAFTSTITNSIDDITL